MRSIALEYRYRTNLEEKDIVEKPFCSCCVTLSDSCYVDAKQYHLASFSTRNSTLNTSLRKPIRMQDFIQLCDSNCNLVTFGSSRPPAVRWLGMRDKLKERLAAS